MAENEILFVIARDHAASEIVHASGCPVRGVVDRGPV
jgi:hypothetical protein